jgi:enamine deaminase RidA (YjgF/YER057c/UK114 family)
MANKIRDRLIELGIELPLAQKPKVAKIKGWSILGNTLYISGMIPQWEGDVRFIGKVGKEFSIEQGREAAHLSALNVLAQAYDALDGDLDRILQIAKVNGFVSCTPEITEVAAVVNGASELFLDIFGERGAHARVAVGVATMPIGVAVEIEAIMEIDCPIKA